MIENRATGSKNLDVAKLKSITDYNVSVNSDCNICSCSHVQKQMSLSNISGKHSRALTQSKDRCTSNSCGEGLVFHLRLIRNITLLHCHMLKMLVYLFLILGKTKISD